MSDTATATETKAKRKPGPISFKYLNEKGETVPKMPSDVSAVIAVDAAGVEKNIALDLSPEVMRSLAVWALVKKADIYVRNTIDTEKPDNALELVQSIIDDIKSGKKTKDASKSASGRKFDVEFWIDVLRSMAEQQGKIADAGKLEDFRMKLEAMEPKARTAYLTSLERNEQFKITVVKLRAAKAKTKESSKPVPDVADLF